MVNRKKTKEALDTLKPIESLFYLLNCAETSINGPDVHDVGVIVLNETRRKLLSVLEDRPDPVFKLERDIDGLGDADPGLDLDPEPVDGESAQEEAL